MMVRLLCTALAGLSVLVSFNAHSADAAAGQNAYQICAACHAPNGEGNIGQNAPRLVGQETWYLKRQMEGFAKGYRGTQPGDVSGMQMKSMSASFTSPEVIDNLVAYISTLDAPPAEPTVQGDAAVGKALYTTCVGCHGSAAEGLEIMNGPKLAGQSDWYLVRQLQNFKKGLRGYHADDVYGMQMKGMAMTLADDAAIMNVVAYINSLAQ